MEEKLHREIISKSKTFQNKTRQTVFSRPEITKIHNENPILTKEKQDLNKKENELPTSPNNVKKSPKFSGLHGLVSKISRPILSTNISKQNIQN